ncbi:MAG: amino acid adenylation domain-containing protein [Nitrospirae bacterium]|nr:amino acid adenylation domain-containing protein [Nitrospirota bacterium]
MNPQINKNFLLQHLLTSGALRDPDAMAVVCRGARLTYGQLERSSDRMARLLCEEGVRPGDRVGIFFPKSAETLTAIFGILKAGAVYVPIDPKGPAQRAAYIIRDCGIQVLLTAAKQKSLLTQILREAAPLRLLLFMDTAASMESTDSRSGRVLAWPEAQAAVTEGRPDLPTIHTDLAYILYTSGSTGRPKGVMLSHLNAMTFVDWAVSYFELRPKDRLSNHAPMHFDLSVFDLFASFKAGASVFPIPEEITFFPIQVAQFIQDHRLTVWYSVPSALIQLLQHGELQRFDLSGLRSVLFAGEVFPVKYLRMLKAALPAAKLFNLYGPTETNVCTVHPVQDLAADQAIPIGKACANAAVVAMNENNEPIQAGETGELCVSGPTVMKGYWGHPDLTAAVLVPGPAEGGGTESVYRTGDLVTINEKGEYLFIGRRDHMIKSRGFRIELGEIEAALVDHPGVQEAAVVAIPDEEAGNRIKAVIVPTAVATLTREEIETHCAKRLPRYMIPEIIEFCKALPRTSTGKMDKTILVKETVRS